MDIERLRQLAYEDHADGEWSADTANARCNEYATLVTALLPALEKLPVFTLARHDGKRMYSVAFTSADDAIAYVIDLYSTDDEPLTAPADGDNVDAWLNAIAESWGVQLKLDEDILNVPLAWAPEVS